MIIKEKYVSNDKTIKYEFYVSAQSMEVVESCLLSLKKHGTVICVSSQIGCQQKCHFCAAGSKPFVRNLSVEEILSQVAYIINDQPTYFEDGFQITYMGSGEPFKNYDVLIQSIYEFFNKYTILTKVNISTILPSLEIDINSFSAFKNKVHFQYSLHFPDDLRRHIHLRETLPSISNSIVLLDQLAKLTNDIYSINYLLLKDINDSDEDAVQVSKLIRPLSYLKVSQFCEVMGVPYLPSERCKEFVEILKLQKVRYEQFYSLGTDVNAGCGQFYNNSIV